MRNRTMTQNTAKKQEKCYFDNHNADNKIHVSAL